MPRALPLLLLPLALAACERQADVPLQQGTVQRVELEGTGQRAAEADPSPDTGEAGWTVSDNGRAIAFGNMGQPPFLTLACDLDKTPTEFVIIRHARAYPGQSALFPVLGNGVSSRFLADTVLADGEWHWEARLPADDPGIRRLRGARPAPR